MEKGLGSIEFDAIFCINLERRKDRKAHASKEFDKLGISPVFYPAIDAHELSIGHQGRLKPGMIGCLLSHYSLLQHCMLNGYQRVLIFEDDLRIITGGIALLEDAMPYLPKDCDFAYIGYSVFPEQAHKTKRVNK